MNKCPNCYLDIENDSNYCNNCGYKLHRSADNV